MVSSAFPNLIIIKHPLIQTKLTTLRDVQTDNYLFRTLLNQISSLMVYEIFRDVEIIEKEVETPLEKTVGYQLAKEITLVPILRAGLGMIGGIQSLIPRARVGHIGLYRDKTTLEAVEYYTKLPPNIAQTKVILIDPMLATGGSAANAITYLKSRNVQDLRFVCLVAAPEGVRRITRDHPDVPIFTAALDRELNQHAYILPGLGDAGDRIYGTE
jgi:uracil phosphoribosyltransferase